MQSPTSRHPPSSFAVSVALVAVLAQGATVLLTSARAEEGPGTDALVPAPSATPASAPASAGSASAAAHAPGVEGAQTEESPAPKQAQQAQQAELDLRSIFDPTVVRRKVGIENELVNLEEIAWIDKTKLSGTFAIGPAQDFDVALRLLVPIACYASETPSGDDAFGLGDVEVTAGLVLRHASWFAHAAAFQVTFDTATDDSLGGNATVLKPFYVASVRPFSFLGAVLDAEYNVSVEEESGVGETRNLELDPSVNFTYPEEWLWFLAVEYKGKLDFENDDYTNRMQVSVGKVLGKTSNISVYFAVEFPLDDKTGQYSVKLGLTYFFD